MRRIFAFAVICLLCLPGAGVASEALTKCRAIANSAERLMCYDAIAVDGASRPVPGAAAASAPVQSAPSRTPTPSANAASSSASTTATQRAPALPATANFGLTQRSPDADLRAIETEIPGTFDGWGPASRIRLSNGQVWQVDDGSTGVCGCTNPKVKVSRGLFGVFYLEIEGKGHAPKVRRVQ